MSIYSEIVAIGQFRAGYRLEGCAGDGSCPVHAPELARIRVLPRLLRGF